VTCCMRTSTDTCTASTASKHAWLLVFGARALMGLRTRSV